MLDEKDYINAKKLYLEGYSLRSIESILGINRKIISIKLKEENINIKYRPSSDIEQKILKLYKSGLSITSISKQLNINRHTISKKLYKNNVISSSNNYINSDLDIKILELYKKKYSIKKISFMLNISANKVWDCLVKNKYSPNKYNKFNFNSNIFKIIDTEAKAYWLGFLYADGYVNETRGLELCLAAKDKNHLEKFKNFIESDQNIKFKKSSNSYRLSIDSIELVQDLIRLGCFQNKSLILDFPVNKQVPENLIHHFMRGYFDGDGCISINTKKKYYLFSVLGTDNFLDKYDSYILNILNKNKPNKRQANGRASSIQYGGRLQILKIYNFLYQDATIYLERKYNKFAVLRQNRMKSQDD